MKYIALLFYLFFLGCTPSGIQEELANVKKELAVANQHIEKLHREIDREGSWVHIVFFKLKPEANKNDLILEIKKLKAINGLKDLEVGVFNDVGDVRALSQYALVMEMSFDDESAFNNYQTHPLHLALKENAKPFLSGPPATFDYLKK